MIIDNWRKPVKKKRVHPPKFDLQRQANSVGVSNYDISIRMNTDRQKVAAWFEGRARLPLKTETLVKQMIADKPARAQLYEDMKSVGLNHMHVANRLNTYNGNVYDWLHCRKDLPSNTESIVREMISERQ
jgi:hypothetical protein